MSPRARSALLATLAVAALMPVLTACGDDAAEPPVATEPAATGVTAPAPAVPTVQVVGGSPVGGPLRVAAHPGETLRFAVVSDTADELHVHGYDAFRPLAPGERVVVVLQADAEGVFEAELHGSGELVARLVIEP
jgi:hypothetical protein